MHASNNHNAVLVHTIIEPIWKASEESSTSLAPDDWVPLGVGVHGENRLVHRFEELLTKPYLSRVVPFITLLDVSSGSRANDQ